MASIDVRDFRDLFGGWSALALIVGLIGGFMIHLETAHSRSQHPREEKTGFIRRLPWVMGAFSAFLELWLVPASKAGSGSIEYWLQRDVARFDIHFAFFIAFTFGFAFAVDALRVRSVRQRESSWLCVALYALAALFMIFNIGSLAQK